MLDQAVVAKSTGITLITTGIILVIIGRIMGPFGWPLVLAGMATIALGWSFIMLGRRLRRSAYDIGTVIKEQYGQKDEGTIVQQCVKQAKALITAEDCDPADKPRIQRGDVEGDEDVFERIGRMPGGGDAFTAATNVDVPAGPDP